MYEIGIGRAFPDTESLQDKRAIEAGTDVDNSVLGEGDFHIFLFII